MTIEFTAYGIPIPMARPRVVHGRDGRVHAHNPRKCEDWKQSIRMQALQFRPEKLLDGPLALTVWFNLPRPKSLPKRVKHPATKPDFDNLVKAVTDACEGILYTNDSRIVWAKIFKCYSDVPCVEVRLEEIDDA